MYEIIKGYKMPQYMRRYVEKVCKKTGVAYPEEMHEFSVQKYMEAELTKLGYDDGYIRELFTSDWEAMML